MDRHPPKRGLVYGPCKECSYARVKTWSATNPELRKEQIRRRRERADLNPVARMWNNAKNRAKRFGMEFSISHADISIPERCPILDIELSRSMMTAATRASSPSLDRIIPSLGYVPGNVRVISFRANTLKLDATYEELRLVLADLARIYGIEP